MPIDRHNSLGAIRDWHDPRDDQHAYRPTNPDPDSYRTMERSLIRVDLRDHFGPPRDQMLTSACVGFAVAAAYEFLYPEKAPLSPWFAYYGARRRGRCVGWDAGCSIRDALKELRHVGIAAESDCPFPVDYAANPVDRSWEQTKALWMPLDDAYESALDTMGCSYHRVRVEHILDCLAEAKETRKCSPPIAGIPVYESAFTAAVEHTGLLPVPQGGDPFAGGHAILIVGKADKGYVARNSWDGHGDGGHLWIPTGYPLAGCDFWTIRRPE